jgi:hypothetical protein
MFLLDLLPGHCDKNKAHLFSTGQGAKVSTATVACHRRFCRRNVASVNEPLFS